MKAEVAERGDMISGKSDSNQAIKVEGGRVGSTTSNTGRMILQSVCARFQNWVVEHSR